MKTELAPKQERLSLPKHQPPSAQREGVPVDWTESEWFKVWLKLARHEDQVQEVAC
jgi:hypothetical protein